MYTTLSQNVLSFLTSFLTSILTSYYFIEVPLILWQTVQFVELDGVVPTLSRSSLT